MAMVSAQETERRRMERDLHDGAQQRHLAAALNLRAAAERSDPTQLRHAAELGIGEIQRAIVELRELANGIHPAALSTGGLRAAIDELVARTPIPIQVSAPDERYPSAVESTAWFVVAEAISNAVKHAHSSGISVTVARTHDELSVAVQDDGRGGADAAGSGLRGLAERAEYIGGTVAVRSGPGGTCVQARLPCG